MKEFEEQLKYKIKIKLDSGLERIDDCKEYMKEQTYINQMNLLKDMNDTFEAIEEADHR